MKSLSKYWLPFIIFTFCLTPIIWFWGKGNVLITGVDTNFPLDPLIWFTRRLYVWSNIFNGGSDFSSSVAGIFFHFIQTVPYILGFGLQQVEIFSLIFWFSLIIFSAFIFSKTFFPSKPLIQILFVVFYGFNIYLFNTWENVKVANLALVAGIPLGLTIVQKLGEGELKYYRSVLYASLTGIILLGSGINPAYFSTFFIALIIFWISRVVCTLNKKTILRETANLMLIGVTIILVNLFWILPTANFISGNISPSSSIDQIGFRNWVDSISQDTSLLNVMRMQGAWDWYAVDPRTHIPFYIPYSLNYFHSITFLFFSFLIPSLVILAFIFRDKSKNYMYLAFGLMFLIGIFLSSGTHPPTGTVYSFFSKHVPFFTLFRSPWYIFAPLVSLSSAVLLSFLFLTVERKCTFLGPRYCRLSILTINFSIIILIASNLIYSYPLIEGKIFRPGRDDSFYIKFPGHIFEAKNKLSLGSEGRVLSYPNDQTETFIWGYRGIDSILALLMDREVVVTPFHSENFSTARVIKRLYQNLEKGQIDSFKRIAGKLNISLIFYKGDQKSLAPLLPQQILDFKLEQYGSWSFYELPKDVFVPKIYSATGFFLAYPYNLAEQSLGIVSSRELIINPGDSVIKGIPSITNGSELVIADNSQVKDFQKFQDPELTQSQRIIAGDVSRVDFVFEIPEAGKYQPLLERYKLDYFGLETEKGLEVEIDGTKTLLFEDKKNDSYIQFNSLELSAGSHILSFKLNPENMIKGGDLSNLEVLEKTGMGKNEGRFEIVKDNQNNKAGFLSILNISGNKEKSVRFHVEGFDPFSIYYIEVKHKQVYGNTGKVTVFQLKDGVNVKIQADSLPNYPEWRTFHTYFKPDSVGSEEMIVRLDAPEIGDPLGTKLFYSNLKVYRVFSNKLFFINRNIKQEQEISSPVVEFKKISPVLYEGIVKGGDKPHIIAFSENYSPGWQFYLSNNVGSLPYIKPVHFLANLYSNAWYVKNAPSKYKFKIYYLPQKLLLVGAIISAGVVISSGLIFFFGQLRRKKGKKDERQS